jgi:hypothetical protein
MALTAPPAPPIKGANTPSKLNFGGSNSSGQGAQIDQTIAAIQDYGTFEYYYSTNECFRGKVNVIYHNYLSGRYNETDITGVVNTPGLDTNNFGSNDNLPVAAKAVHNNYLNEAQLALAQCLENTKAAEFTPDNPLIDINSNYGIPGSTIISPFDRRLDRLKNGSSIIPISTAFAEAATMGYSVSTNYIKESKVEGVQKIIDIVKDQTKMLQNDDFYIGVPSLMNNYAHIKLYGSVGGQLMINQKGKRKWYEVDQTINGLNLNTSQTPTTTSLIEWGNEDPYGRTPYNFSDFIFCKHWKKVPNNRLITLRRYAAPIVDNLKFPGMNGSQSSGNPASSNPADKLKQNGTPGSNDGGSTSKVMFPPMASAITYFGEETDNKIGDILKFTTGFDWDEVEANVWNTTTASNPDNEAGPGGLWSGLTKFAKTLNVATGNWNQNATLNGGMLPPDPYVDGPYENRIIGPVNRITSVKKRKAGIKFEMSGIELKFDYVARPIGGINTKVVLLDILSNFLIIGSTSAVFWGGQHRFMSNPQKYPFIGGAEGMQQWYAGKPIEWGSTTIKQFVGTTQNVSTDLFEKAKNFFNSLLGNGDGNKDLFGSLNNVFTGNGVAGNVIKNFAAEKSSGQIPYLQNLKALLIGEPVGEWHVTVGNPLNPIAMIGNLVCESLQVEFGNEIGPDDFPTEMRITVKLSHGMARDKDAIQSIFNRGMGRIYDLPDTFRGSAEDETKVDNKTGNAPLTGRNPVYYRVPVGSAGTTGGKFDRGATTDNNMNGSTSVWKESRSYSASPNSNEEIIRENALFRSSYKTADWVALKSLK